VIAKSAPTRRSGRGSFSALSQYLEVDELGRKRDDLIASWSGGVASHETAALEMEAVARNYARAAGTRSRTTEDPVYHVILSTRPGEALDVDGAKLAVDAVRRSLDADRHQYFAALHHDVDTDRYHVHLAINKVSLDGRTLDRWQDYAKLARAAEWCERELGLQVDRHAAWREKLGERELGEIAHVQGPTIGTAHGLDRQQGASIDRRDAVRRAHYSWVEVLKREAVPAALQAVAREGARWDDVHAVLRGYGVRLEAAGSGARMVGPERGQHVKASDVGLDVRGLELQLGAFAVNREAEVTWQRRIGFAQASIRSAQSWSGLHRELVPLGFAVQKVGRGGRVLDIETARHLPLRRVATSMVRLEERLGSYELSPAVAARDAREAVRREVGIAERVERLRAQPELVIDRLAETRSVWNGADIEREVRSALGVRSGHDQHIAAATRAVVGASLAIDTDTYTIARVVSEERAVFAAAKTLADRERTVELRAPDDGLDAQQRTAYARLAGKPDLAIVTGIAGAGKSRLQRDVAAAYGEAGFRVIGTAVAGDAARTLGEQAHLDTRTVARLLVDLKIGRAQFDRWTVLMVDEAGTLGAAQARELFERARDAGARVMLLGDTAQHESVGRGSVLRGLVEENGALDLQKTRRASEAWLRDVASDLRAGVVSRALDVLRDMGTVREFGTHDEARAALVQSWADATRAGKSALLVASRNDDVRAMNELARDAMRTRMGEERVYATDFGERSFGVGDVLVGRERAHGGVNGDLYTLTGHRYDGRLELVRQRDKQRVVWDLHEHGAIDHGYATTSYRSQGRTVDSVFALASSVEARRGLYVDVTRAREEVTIAYGRDEVRDFGELLLRAQRDQRKALVRDVERVVSVRVVRELERERVRQWQQELQLERAPVIEPRREPKTNRERDRSRGWGMGR
jgi:hypothetical protein